jgi:hypothetical protein
VEARDRLANLGTFAAAAASWVLVGLLVLTRDPREDPASGIVGAGLMGLATVLTTVPLFWLAAFGRHRRIAYRGDWFRAARRGLWVGLVVGLFVALRLQAILSLPIAVFVIVLVVFAELTLSIER